MSRSGRASRSNRAPNSVWTLLAEFVMSLLSSRHHGVDPAPRKPLARPVQGAPCWGIVTQLAHVQIDVEGSQLPTQQVQPNRHVHVMHPEIVHFRCEHRGIDPGDAGMAVPDRSGGQVSRHHAATCSDSASTVSRAAVVSLRIWTACTIWITPRIISDAPETRVSTTMESNGQTSTTAPAINDMTPKTTYQPRPGRSRSPSATAFSETPRKMKPVPIHSDSSKTA